KGPSARPGRAAGAGYIDQIAARRAIAATGHGTEKKQRREINGNEGARGQRRIRKAVGRWQGNSDGVQPGAECTLAPSPLWPIGSRSRIPRPDLVPHVAHHRGRNALAERGSPRKGRRSAARQPRRASSTARALSRWPSRVLPQMVHIRTLDDPGVTMSAAAENVDRLLTL